MGSVNTIIFDFDQTIADTSSLDNLRKSRNWSQVYNNINTIKPYDGIHEVFKFLKANNYKIGIVTSSPSKYCLAALEFLKLEFDVVVGYHDTVLKKPNPDPILLAIDRLNSNPANCLGVGDNVSDMLAYNRANIISAAATWSFIESIPNYCYTLNYPLGLIELLNHLNQTK